MAKRKWNSLKLRRQCRMYGWLGLVGMIGAVVIFTTSPSSTSAVLISATLAFILIALAFRTESKDKKLRRDEDG